LDPQEIYVAAEALAAAGAKAVVSSMATDAWHGARAGVAKLFRSRPDVGDQLDSDAALLARQPVAEVDAVRDELAAPWRRRLLALLADHPDARGELTALIADIQRGLPAQPAGSVQHILVTGRSVANVVQNGSQYNITMDGPDGDVAR
jgi:hypothetical protein